MDLGEKYAAQHVFFSVHQLCSGSLNGFLGVQPPALHGCSAPGDGLTPSIVEGALCEAQARTGAFG